jgi:hypothetical protein
MRLATLVHLSSRVARPQLESAVLCRCWPEAESPVGGCLCVPAMGHKRAATLWSPAGTRLTGGVVQCRSRQEVALFLVRLRLRVVALETCLAMWSSRQEGD